MVWVSAYERALLEDFTLQLEVSSFSAKNWELALCLILIGVYSLGFTSNRIIGMFVVPLSGVLN